MTRRSVTRSGGAARGSGGSAAAGKKKKAATSKRKATTKAVATRLGKDTTKAVETSKRKATTKAVPTRSGTDTSRARVTREREVDAKAGSAACSAARPGRRRRRSPPSPSSRTSPSTRRRRSRRSTPRPSPRGAATPPPAKSRGDVRLYDSIGARASAHILEASRAGRDIAPAPPCRDPKLRDDCMADLRTFLERCFPATFTMRWSQDHLLVIDHTQRVVEHGGQFALAMPRGSGKTSIFERAMLWAVLRGSRRFVPLIAANESLAENSLGRIQSELEFNEELLDLWPKAIYPIRKLESQARRCVGQLYEGQRTAIVWKAKRLVLPTMAAPDNEASGAVLHVGGLTGAIRGLAHVTTSGETIRPDLVLIDDPQDRESARSAVQTAERLALLNGDILGLAGPGKKIAALMTCTVIQRGDLADQVLDREKSPVWQGRRFQMLNSMPSAEELWDKYGTIRTESLRAGGNGSEATDFYRTHRAAMDAGADASWPERFNDDEVSAVQHAMNLKLDRGDHAFWAEFQNKPLDAAAEIETLDPKAIAARVGGLQRGTAGPEAEKVTAFIDVGQDVLWWMVCGWDEAFGCTIMDYGTWPEQRSRIFAARNASPTLGQVYASTTGVEATVYAGLADLVAKLAGRDWQRTDGAVLPLVRVMIDSGWSTDAVRLFIRQSERRQVMTPSKGIGIGPGQTAIAEYKRRLGERIGDGWIMGVTGPDGLRLLRFDSNHWKSRVSGMLTRPMGAKGGVTLWGAKAIDHELLALHLSSETPTRTEARGNAVNVWNRRPDRDNHWFDCLVGCAVAASLEGVSPLTAMGGGVRPIRPRMRASELQAAARRKRLHGTR